jgi:hypothetical protein
MTPQVISTWHWFSGLFFIFVRCPVFCTFFFSFYHMFYYHYLTLNLPCMKEILRRRISVKGTVTRDFLLLVFFMVSFPPAPEYSIQTVSNFFKNSRICSQVKVHHRYQRHWRQIFQPISQVLLIPVANMPLVSTTLVANCHRYQQHRRQICHRCK